jgi:iron complex transport system substrate-binding protein
MCYKWRPTLPFILMGVLLLANFPVSAKEVVDQLGRRVQVPKHPIRVVALAPSITEIVFALDAGDRLKGVTRFSNFPPQAENLPKVGSYVQLDLEKIMAIQPDLCIAVKDGNPKEVIDRLDHLGIPVYAVDPRNLHALTGTILEIGNLLDVIPKARSLVKQLEEKTRIITSKIAGATQRPTVFFQIGITPIVSAGTDTFIHELITLAGGINLAQGPVPYPRFSREQILSLSPEVFIITSMTRGASFDQIKAEWQRWPQMPAVKNNRIHLIDSDLVDRASPRLVEGLEVLAGLIHPMLFR